MWTTIKNIFRKKEDPSISRTLKKNRTSLGTIKMNNRLSRYGILALTLLCISYFFPSPNSFNFIYSEGEPWHYAPLYSLYKFNINMSDSVLETKKDSVKKVFEPYYEKDASIVDSVKRAVEAEARKLINENPRYLNKRVALYLRQLKTTIDSIYSKGVVYQTSYDSLLNAGTNYIRVVDNNVAYPTDFNDIYCEKTTYRRLTSTQGYDLSTDSLHTQFLLALNLNALIRPNLVYDKMKSDLELNSMIDSLSPNIGFVMENERIIDRGEIITRDKLVKLKSYENIVKEKNASERSFTMILGQILMVIAILLILNSFLLIFRRDYFKNIKIYIMLFSFVTIFCVLASLIIEHHFMHVFIIPFCIVP